MNAKCPKCGEDVAFSWLGVDVGSVVPARCMKLELQNYQRLPAGIAPCDWTGHVERGSDGSVIVRAAA